MLKCLRLAIGGRSAPCCLSTKDLPMLVWSIRTLWSPSATTCSRFWSRTSLRWTRTFWWIRPLSKSLQQHPRLRSKSLQQRHPRLRSKSLQPWKGLPVFATWSRSCRRKGSMCRRMWKCQCRRSWRKSRRSVPSEVANWQLEGGEKDLRLFATVVGFWWVGAGNRWALALERYNRCVLALERSQPLCPCLGAVTTAAVPLHWSGHNRCVLALERSQPLCPCVGAVTTAVSLPWSGHNRCALALERSQPLCPRVGAVTTAVSLPWSGHNRCALALERLQPLVETALERSQPLWWFALQLHGSGAKFSNYSTFAELLRRNHVSQNGSNISSFCRAVYSWIHSMCKI